MTPAERQRRYRAKVRREARAAAKEAKRATNLEKYRGHMQATPPGEWVSVLSRPPMDNPADELVEQLAEALQLQPELDIDDIRDAIDRRYGPRAATTHHEETSC